MTGSILTQGQGQWVGGWVQQVVLGVLWQGLGLALPGGSACSVMVAGMDREAQRPPLLSLSLQPCPPRRHCPAPSAAADPRAAHLDFHWHGRLQASPAHRGPAARTGKRQSQTAGCLLAACLLPACCLLSPGGRPPLRGLRPFCPAAAVSERVPLGCDWVPPFDLPCCQVIQEIVERDLVAGAEEQKAA